jgi:MFS transporter, CP family, cyanate transporter
MTGMPTRVDRSLLVIAAGVAAAIHVAKLPPALPALRDSLGIGLVEAGFLISLVQLAGMSLGLFVGLAADGLGLRRTLLMGLGLLTVASLAGGFASSAPALLVLRALEGLGFLLAVMPGPGLIRRHVRDSTLALRLGLWGTYMPVGTALALLIGPVWIAHWRWPAWWWLASALSALMAAAVLLALPADPLRRALTPATGEGARDSAWRQRLLQTLRSRGPWLVAMAFAVYSAQWIAVIGFLPSIYAQAGLAPVAAGLATALAAGVNMVGNIAAGRFLNRGVAPERLLQAGYGTMAVAGVLAFAPVWPAVPGLGVLGPYLAVLAFSSVGGLVPGTLFSLSVRLAPHPQAVSTTVGWMQQWSALGQFGGPPVLAWIATRSGGWGWSWVFTVACAVSGLWLALVIGAERRRLAALAA